MVYSIIDNEVEEKFRKIKWLRHQDGSICRTWLSEGNFNLIKLDIYDEELEGYSFYKIPVGEVDITEGDTVRITITGRNQARFGGSDLRYYPLNEDDLDEYAEYEKVTKVFRDSKEAEIRPMFLDDTILFRPAEEIKKEHELYSESESGDKSFSNEASVLYKVAISTENETVSGVIRFMDENNVTIVDKDGKEVSVSISDIKTYFIMEDTGKFYSQLLKTDSRREKLLEELEESDKTIGEVMNISDADKADYHVSIKYLPFTQRPYNCFRRACLLYLDDILPMTYKNLLKIRNLGKKSVVETISIINMYQALVR